MQPHYDIIIIGAGIHGAGVAQAAAAQGYSVAVLEQYTSAAAGTSSRSSKLIHGGLRYLESGQIKLVYECLRERGRLLQNAPQLVQMQAFYIPVYRDSRRPPWLIRCGLSLYTILAGLGTTAQSKYGFRALAKSDWSTLDGLRQQQLRAVFRYYDAQTDDRVLTQAVLASAESMGAQTLLATEFISADATATGYRVRCNNATGEHTLTAKVLVNAAGPWVNQVMARISPVPNVLPIELVQGTHICLPGALQHGIYYLEAPLDQRVVFAMPWQSNIMLGTTERLFNGDPAQCAPSPAEIDYLLSTFNHYFPDFYPTGPATVDQITDSFAGLRVLPKNSQNPFARSRETLFSYDAITQPRLIAIYGGKLTSYRATAEKVLRRINKTITPKSKRTTRRLGL